MLRRYPDPEALAVAAADEVERRAITGVAAAGRCHIALSGGGTPRRMFELLAARGRRALPWDAIELWWIDERTVPPDHLDSNYGAARAALIEPLALDPQRVHRMRGEAPDPDAAARAYEAELVAAIGDPPVLDLAMLGIGVDGHTASLFPHSPALGVTDRWVAANRAVVNGTPTARITLTAPMIEAARAIRFVVEGAAKAPALAATLFGPRDPDRYPAQRFARADWLVDEAAASRLGGAA